MWSLITGLQISFDTGSKNRLDTLRRALFRRISRQGAGVGDRYRTSLSDALPFVGPHSHCAMLVLRFLGLALLRLLPNELIYSLGP